MGSKGQVPMRFHIASAVRSAALPTVLRLAKVVRIRMRSGPAAIWRTVLPFRCRFFRDCRYWRCRAGGRARFFDAVTFARSLSQPEKL